MPSENKSVLIICTAFPPFPGIGGRRWAKFAKYFAKNKVTCHVINAVNYSKTVSLWNKDVEAPNIYIHPLKLRFQYWFGHNSKSLLYRIAAKLLRMAVNLTKYSPHIETSLSRKRLINKSIPLIKEHNIKTVVVSGDPYLHYYALEIKKTCNIKLILDYRDTWNDRLFYSQDRYHKLTAKQRSFFENCEAQSLRDCDEIACVYEPFIDLLAARSGKDKKHFHVIPNGYDVDDYAEIKKNSANSEKVILYFGGNISPGDRADYFLKFLQAYSGLNESNRQLWEQFKIVINGNAPKYFREALAKLNDPNISFEPGFISNSLYLERLQNSNYGILSIPDEYIDCFFITKAYDYLEMQKLIIYLGKPGKVSEYIESNGIGFAFNNAEKTQTFFTKLAESRNKTQYPENVKKMIEKNYELNYLALNYLALIN